MDRHWTLGRSPDCDIVVDMPHVSRHHARVTATASGFVIEDLGSQAGTTINGMPLSGHRPLHRGDIVRFGSTHVPEHLLAPVFSTPRGQIDEASGRNIGYDAGGGGSRRLPPRKRSGSAWLVGGGVALLLAGAVAATLAWHRDQQTAESTQESTEDAPAILPDWAKDAVFMVAMAPQDGSEITPVGTAFALHDEKVLLTNAHVVADIEALCLVEEKCSGLVIGNNKPNLKLTIVKIVTHPKADTPSENDSVERPDLALIYVDEPERLPRGLPLASNDTVTNDRLQGREVAILGFPGQTMDPNEPLATVSRGTVGRVAKDDYIQHDASMSPGNSGSPLLIGGPSVVGVNFAAKGIRVVLTADSNGAPTLERINQASGLNMAVGVRLVRELLNSR